MVILGNSRIPASSGIVEHQNDGSIDRLLHRFRRLTNHSPSFHFAKKQRHSCDKGKHSKDMRKQTCRDNPFAQGGAWRHFIKAGRWVVGELDWTWVTGIRGYLKGKAGGLWDLEVQFCFKKAVSTSEAKHVLLKQFWGENIGILLDGFHCFTMLIFRERVSAEKVFKTGSVIRKTHHFRPILYDSESLKS